MTSQSVRPIRWVIVNDGSTDATGRILADAAKSHSWIQVLNRADRGRRKPGGGVVDAFYDGYRLVEAEPWEYLVKLDGDLSFDSDYFEKCFSHFTDDARLGIGGGTICQRINGQLVVEAPGDPLFHVRGATKIYRRECWAAIGGLLAAPGWDTVDEYKANMLGWTTYTFPEKIWHHRKAGEVQGSWKNWVKNGLANYVAGYHPVFMGFKCGKRIFAKPYGIGALGLLVGFVRGYLQRVPQVNDPDLIRYVRSQQLRKLSLRSSLWGRRPL